MEGEDFSIKEEAKDLNFLIFSSGRETVMARESKWNPKWVRLWEGTSTDFLVLIEKPKRQRSSTVVFKWERRRSWEEAARKISSK